MHPPAHAAGWNNKYKRPGGGGGGAEGAAACPIWPALDHGVMGGGCGSIPGCSAERQAGTAVKPRGCASPTSPFGAALGASRAAPAVAAAAGHSSGLDGRAVATTPPPATAAAGETAGQRQRQQGHRRRATAPASKDLGERATPPPNATAGGAIASNLGGEPPLASCFCDFLRNFATRKHCHEARGRCLYDEVLPQSVPDTTKHTGSSRTHTHTRAPEPMAGGTGLGRKGGPAQRRRRRSTEYARKCTGRLRKD
jgi:hypothetical protein